MDRAEHKAKLAELHERRGNMERAYRYHLKNLERLGANGAGGGELVNTLRFLAQHCAETGNLGEAEGYCMRLLDFGGNHREEAKMLDVGVSVDRRSLSTSVRCTTKIRCRPWFASCVHKITYSGLRASPAFTGKTASGCSSCRWYRGT